MENPNRNWMIWYPYDSGNLHPWMIEFWEVLGLSKTENHWVPWSLEPPKLVAGGVTLEWKQPLGTSFQF